MKDAILTHLSDAYPWKDRIHWFDSISSTNDRLRYMAREGAPHGTALIAGHQTGGHGRRGRSFHSPEGAGVYLSILLRPGCAPSQLMHLTCATAVAMCGAVEEAAGFRPGIKWTNDLVFRKRKLGGILTELGFTPEGNVDWAIIGIGINCSQRAEDFPEEIRSFAGSLSMAAGHAVSREKLAAAMLEALWHMDRILLSGKAAVLEQYRRDCVTLGQEIVLVRGEEKHYGKAVSIDKEGALLVDFGRGGPEAVNSGEVSIRGMYGYV